MSWKTRYFRLQAHEHQSRFGQYAFEEDHREIWQEARILETE